jgi:uncharacterized membrane protein YfhO
MKKIERKKLAEYAIPAVIAFLIYVVILAVRGIFPFGSGSAGSIDYNEQRLPIYIYLWDVLHFKVGAFFSSVLGGGTAIYSISGWLALLNPLIWLVGLFPREYVDQSMSLVIGLTVVLAAWSAYFSFKKLFPKTGKYYLLFFAVMWAVSPFAVIHYQIYEWLNMLVLLPLLILSIKNLYENNKILPFVLAMTGCLVFSFYLSFALMFTVILIAAVFFALNFKEQKKFAVNVLIGLAFAFGLSMVFILPALLSSLQSYRFSDIAAPEYQYFWGKLIVIGWWILPVVISVKYFIYHFGGDKKTARFFLISLGILLAGFVCERINMSWSGGSYYDFPYRYGFIVLFAFMYISLYYLNNFKTADDVRPIVLRGRIIFALSVSALIYVGGMVYYLLAANSSYLHPAFRLHWIIGLIIVGISVFGFFAYTFALKFNRAVTRNILAGVFSVISVFMLSFSHFGTSYNDEAAQTRFAYTVKTDSFELPYRIKDKDDRLYYNYPLILNYPSLSTWAHLTPQDQTLAYRYLGYNESGARLSDDGGTLFSDMLLGVKYVLSSEKLNEHNTVYSVAKNRYEYKTDGDIISQYELVNTLPFVQLLDKDTDISEINADDLVAAQNEIYKKFFMGEDYEGQLLTKLSITRTPVADNSVLHIKIPSTSLAQETALYLYVENTKDAYIFSRADWQENETKYTKDPDAFIAEFGTPLKNGFNDMGIEYNTTKDYYIYAPNTNSANIYAAGLRTADLGIVAQTAFARNPNLADEIKNTFENTAAGVKFKITAGENQQAFIPMTYLNGMTAKINGKTVTVKKALTSFIALDLVDGENEIELIFMPDQYYWGLGITIFSVLTLIAFVLLNKRFNFTNNKFVQTVIFSIGGIVVFVITFYIFIKPLFLTVLDIF